MRAYILNALTGALGLAAVVASAPTLSTLGTVDSCEARSTATVFVTVPASSPEPSTVYVTIAVSSVEVNPSVVPTTTLTRFVTLSSTTTGPHTFTEYISVTSTSAGQVNPGSSYGSTTTEVATVTITNVNLTPLESGASVTFTETPAPNGLFNYVVQNGTTYWLDGQTPSPAESYVYSTRSVTVEPVYASESSSEAATSTLTLQSTVFVTQQLTLTETLESTSSSSRQGLLTPVSVGTGLPYTKGPGGWNSTKTANTGGVSSSAINGISVSPSVDAFANASTTLVLHSSLNIYETIHSIISKSSFAAQSGFNVLSTSISAHAISLTISDPGTAASSAKGEKSTAAINNQNLTWGASLNAGFTPLTSTCTETPGIPASTVAPYINSTFATSFLVSSAASGALTSLKSSASGIAYGSSYVLVNSTASASSAFNALTSSSSTKPSSIISVGSYNYSSPVASSTASSSAIKGSTSLSSSTSTILSSSISSRANTSSSVVASSNLGSTYTASTSVPAYSSTLVPSSTFSSKTSTWVSSSALTSSTCGEYGKFTLNFDDIPPLSINNQTDQNTVQPEPVFNPYHQFDFSDGFTVVPPPKAPYNPSSPPLFLEFIPNFNVNGTNTQAGPNTVEEGYSGQISDGDDDRTGCFRFNMYGASMGCDSTGPACEFTFTGYQLDAARNEVMVATQFKTVPACPALRNCNLTRIDLDYNFVNLTFVRINVTVGGQPKIWWMDDLRLEWYDNSCTRGLCRQSTHLP